MYIVIIIINVTSYGIKFFNRYIKEDRNSFENLGFTSESLLTQEKYNE